MRLVLFQPDIPQNVGAALRLGACLNTAVDIIEPCGFPLSDPGVRRAAMDYADQVEFTRHSGWTSFLASPERKAGRLLLFSTRAALPIHDFVFRPTDLLMVGRESAGVPDDVHDAADERIFIPLAVGARSFNVTVAAAIGLSEALRQTGLFPKPSA
jgi:tRNA (cytidine/uridine-2'-O-)-methyltransferase